MSRFAGFPEAALVFYEVLQADNSKAYWTDHRDVYERDVKAPAEALLAALEPEFGPGTLFRPYRDVRFSKDKTPYKTQAALTVGGLYLALSADGLFLGGGYHSCSTDQSRRLRAALADDRTGATLVRLAEELRADGWQVDGERLKRLPKELPADSPRAEWLTLKTLVASQAPEPGEWLHEPECQDVVVTAWRRLVPFVAWLDEHVGPPRDTVQR